MNTSTEIDLEPCDKYTDEFCEQMESQELHRLLKKMNKEISYLESLLALNRTDGTMPMKEYIPHKQWENVKRAEIAKRRYVNSTAKLILSDRRDVAMDALRIKLSTLHKELYTELLTWDLTDHPNVESMLRKYEELIRECHSLREGA